MKHKLLILIIALLSSLSSIADDIPNDPQINIKGTGNKKGKGGRDVSSPVPQCYISEGILYVVSPDDWSYATVTIEEAVSGAQSVSSGYLDEGIAVFIPATEGYFIINIATESGDEFEGEFCL
ncbi:MAG: hypothetical protein HDS68_06935 [Bacteroidales bacterium]|nr:hypothetical protein [Bacteroidales bacterium]